MPTIKDTEIQYVNIFNNKLYINAAHRAALYALDLYIKNNTNSMPIDLARIQSKKVPEDENAKCIADILAPVKSIRKWIDGRQPIKPNLSTEDISAFDDCFLNSAVTNGTIEDGEYTLSIKTNRPHSDKTEKNTKIESIDINGVKLLAEIYLTNFICGAQTDYKKFKNIRKELFFKIIDCKPVQTGIWKRIEKVAEGFQDWVIRYRITFNNKATLDELHELAIKKCGIDTSKYEIIPGKAFNSGIKLKQPYLLTIIKKDTKPDEETTILPTDAKFKKFFEKKIHKKLKNEIIGLKPIIAKYFKTFIMPLESDIITDIDRIFNTIGKNLVADCMYTSVDVDEDGMRAYLRFVFESAPNINTKIVSLVNANSNKSAKTLIENIVTNKLRSKIIETLK